MSAMPQKRLGYVLSVEQFPAQRLIELAMAAEQAGFDVIWLSDHFHPWQDNQGHASHAWLLLAAIGQRTSRVTLGSAVTCPFYRYNPADVAQAFATLGILYPGRVFLGVGTGESVNEVPPGGGWRPYPERAKRLEESIEIISRLWSEDWVTYEGRFHRVTGANIYDKPSPPVPIYVAAGGPRSAMLAGRLGDGWITDVAALLLSNRAPVRDAFSEAVRNSGREPSDLRVLVESYVVLGDQRDAEYAANMWRFLPIGADMLQVADPRIIQQRAEVEVPIERTLRRFSYLQNPLRMSLASASSSTQERPTSSSMPRNSTRKGC